MLAIAETRPTYNALPSNSLNKPNLGKQFNQKPKSTTIDNSFFARSTRFVTTIKEVQTSDLDIIWFDEQSQISRRELQRQSSFEGLITRQKSLELLLSALSKPQPVESVVFPVDRLLSEIRTVLGVSKSTLATLFGVTRPTIYSWLQGSPLHQKHQELIERLHKRSSLWSTYSSTPPALALTATRVYGKTLAEWLANPETSEEQLIKAMRELSEYVDRTARVMKVVQKTLDDGFGEDLLDR